MGSQGDVGVCGGGVWCDVGCCGHGMGKGRCIPYCFVVVVVVQEAPIHPLTPVNQQQQTSVSSSSTTTTTTTPHTQEPVASIKVVWVWSSLVLLMTLRVLTIWVPYVRQSPPFDVLAMRDGEGSGSGGVSSRTVAEDKDT